MFKKIKNLEKPWSIFSSATTIRCYKSNLPRAGTLITGNFSYFSYYEAHTIQAILDEKKNVIVLVMDRGLSQVPANERALWIRRYFATNPNIEVRVANHAPEELSSENIAAIKKQLPTNFKVIEVGCNHQYSAQLAKTLAAVWRKSREKNPEQTIDADFEKNQYLITPEARQRIYKRFEKNLSETEFLALCEEKIMQVKKEIKQLNPNHPDPFVALKPPLKKILWDLNKINLPVVIGSVQQAQEHNYFGDFNQTQVYRMLIFAPNYGWKIPIEFSGIKNTLATIVAAEKCCNENVEQEFVYLTMDRNIVYPGQYARHPGLHIDGTVSTVNYLTGNTKTQWAGHTYLVSDRLQTEFYPGPFQLTGIDINCASTFFAELDKQGKNAHYKQYQPYDIVQLTPNHVHAVHPNQTNHKIARSFLQLSFSKFFFNRPSTGYYHRNFENSNSSMGIT